MRTLRALVLWMITFGLFYLACYVQQAWFRAETPLRGLFYGFEAATCGLFLFAGMETARFGDRRFGPAALKSILGGLGSALVAGLLVSLFLRHRCPFHGEWSVLFFWIPFALLAVLAPAYWYRLWRLVLQRSKTQEKNPGNL